MPIRKLPPLLINQIAAGEVIERPASVVKELVENSLDAGAAHIDLTIEDGGHRLIRVADDGGGIPPQELPLALTQHATSKLETPEQLAAIQTLGFRGEALASVSSVSRLRLTSRTPHDDAAHVIEAAGAEVTDPAPASAAPGTVVEVRDLFFNTPARRKFLRTAATEFGHIHDAVSRIAMMHPAVAFKLTHNGRRVLDLTATDDRARRVIDVLGRDIAEAMLEFERVDPPDQGGAVVWGMAGQPDIARATGKFLYLALNGRAVRDRNLTHAVKEAYRGLIPHDKHPVAAVFLTVDPAMVDVNVHPAKAEVRFRNPSYVHGLVLAGVRQRLLGADLTPSVETGGWKMTDDAGPAAPAAAPTANEFVDYFRQMDPKQKGFVYEEVKRAAAEDNIFLNDDTPAAEISPAPPPAVAPAPILQVHNSYVVTEDRDGLLIVDQHALHERVMFETLRNRVLGDGQPLESQRLLMPQIVDADAKRQALLEDLRPLLRRIGVEAEPISPTAIAIQAFPSFLFDRKVDAGPFLAELLDLAAEGGLDTSRPNAEEAALHEVLDMMACKAAVKAGDQLTPAELAALLEKRAEVERSSACPHGRPTTLRLTLKDLEKQFGRT